MHEKLTNVKFYTTHKKESKKINRLIRDLYFKKAVYEEFQKNPSAVGARYKVSNKIINAIKNGDVAFLVQKGMNPKFLEDPAYRLVDRLKMRFYRVLFAGLVAIGLIINLPRFATARPMQPRDDGGLLRATRRLRRKIESGTRDKLALLRAMRKIARNSRLLARRKEGVLLRLRRIGASLNAREIARTLAGRRTQRARNVREILVSIPLSANEIPNAEVNSSSIMLLDPIE